MEARANSKIEKAFDEYERDTVRLRDELNEEAKDVYPEVCGAAEAAFPGKTESRRGGSWGRRTVAGPWLKDIDIIVEFDDVDELLQGRASPFLDRVAEAALECALARTARPRRRAVECSLRDYEFTVDIVPGICAPDGKRLYLANVSTKDNTDGWQLLHPRGQLTAARAKNVAMAGLYIRVVRVVKYWNQSFGKENKPLRSYHAESLVYHSIDGASGFVEAVLAFFDHAYKKLESGQRTSDPGDSGQFVDALLEDHERAKARAVVAQARQTAREAAELEDPDQAAEVWGSIFPGFPSPSMSTASVRKALAAGAGITDAGVVPGRRGREVPRTRSWRRG